MKFTVKIGSGFMMYIRSFIKIGSGIQKLMAEEGIHRKQGDLISLLLFIFSKMWKVGKKSATNRLAQQALSINLDNVKKHNICTNMP
jgi:hypothetical protein